MGPTLGIEAAGPGVGPRATVGQGGNQGIFNFQILQMNNSYFPMRYLAAVALLLFGSMSVASAIPPAFLGPNGQFRNRTSISGEVTHVDQNARTFTVYNKRIRNQRSAGDVSGGEARTVEATFNTTAKTTYVSGFWTNMKKGIHIRVTCHLEGPNSDTVVADNIRIWSLSPW